VKRLLVISYYFPPMGGGGINRITGLLKYLPLHGWQPVVVTARDPGYRVIDREAALRSEEMFIVERVSRGLAPAVGRLLAGERDGGRSGRRQRLLKSLADFVLVPDPYVSWLPPAVRAGMRAVAVHRPAAIWTTSPPLTVHLVGMILAAWSGLKWVADFRDPWTKWMFLGTPTAVHRAVHSFLERLVLRTADGVTAVHPGFFDTVPGKPVVTIPGGFNSAPAVGRRINSGSGPAFELVYTGSLTLGVSASPFLRGLSLYRERRGGEGVPLRVRFVGFRERENESLVSRLGLGDIVAFSNPVPHATALELQAAADGLLLLLPDIPGVEVCYAGKLFEYLAARRPIFAVVPRRSAAAKLVEDYNAGLVVDPGDPTAIAAALERFVRGDYYFNPPAAVLADNFHFSRLSAKLADLLER